MIRKCLTDERRARIEWELPGKLGYLGRRAKDNRLFVEALCRTGACGRPRSLQPAPPVLTWTGIYLGGQSGYAFGDNTGNGFSRRPAACPAPIFCNPKHKA